MVGSSNCQNTTLMCDWQARGLLNWMFWCWAKWRTANKIYLRKEAKIWSTWIIQKKIIRCILGIQIHLNLTSLPTPPGKYLIIESNKVAVGVTLFASTSAPKVFSTPKTAKQFASAVLHFSGESPAFLSTLVTRWSSNGQKKLSKVCSQVECTWNWKGWTETVALLSVPQRPRVGIRAVLFAKESHSTYKNGRKKEII